MAEVDNANWNVDMEVNLFHAMRRHKPVGTIDGAFSNRDIVIHVA